MKNEKLEKAFEDLKKAIRDIEDAGGSILFELNATNDANIKGVYYNEYLNGVYFYQSIPHSSGGVFFCPKGEGYYTSAI